MSKKGYEKMTKLDYLVENNGDWKVIYIYNRFGDPTLLLLPNFDPSLDSSETRKNNAIIDMCDGVYEEAAIIEKYIKTFPEHPFMVQEPCISDAIRVMNEKLNTLIPNDNYDKFNDAFEIFDCFSGMCDTICNDKSTGEALMYDMYYKEWTIKNNMFYLDDKENKK